MEKTNEISENEFLIRYWTEKAKLIDQVRKDNDYSSIVAIDDDRVVCYILRRLNFEVYQAKITKQYLNQSLSIFFNRLSSFFTTQTQDSFEHPQNQESIAKEVIT